MDSYWEDQIIGSMEDYEPINYVDELREEGFIPLNYEDIESLKELKSFKIQSNCNTFIENVYIVRCTDKAILLERIDKHDRFWIPKSLLFKDSNDVIVPSFFYNSVKYIKVTEPVTEEEYIILEKKPYIILTDFRNSNPRKVKIAKKTEKALLLEGINKNYIFWIPKALIFKGNDIFYPPNFKENTIYK